MTDRDEHFPSVRQAAAALGHPGSNFIRDAIARGTQAYGRRWRWADDPVPEAWAKPAPSKKWFTPSETPQGSLTVVRDKQWRGERAERTFERAAAAHSSDERMAALRKAAQRIANTLAKRERRRLAKISAQSNGGT